jgi:hypothetical protein
VCFLALVPLEFRIPPGSLLPDERHTQVSTNTNVAAAPCTRTVALIVALTLALNRRARRDGEKKHKRRAKKKKGKRVKGKIRGNRRWMEKGGSTCTSAIDDININI